jgi:hypothetical protein
MFHNEYDSDTVIIEINSILSESWFNTERLAHQYDIKCDFSKKDIKSLFYHSVITILCDVLTGNDIRGKRKILYIGDTSCTGSDMNVQTTGEFIIKKIQTLLPFQVVDVNRVSFNEFKKSDDYNHIVDHHIALDMEYDKTKYSLQKLKGFLKRNGLKYLDDVYFKQLHTKLALVT